MSDEETPALIAKRINKIAEENLQPFTIRASS